MAFLMLSLGAVAIGWMLGWAWRAPRRPEPVPVPVPVRVSPSGATRRRRRR
jgi:hypothetical protein